MFERQIVRENSLPLFCFYCPLFEKTPLKICPYPFCHSLTLRQEKISNAKNMNGLLEILTNKQWMIRPEFVHSIRSVIQSNLNNHVELNEEKEQEMGCRIVFTREGVETRIKEERYSAKDGRYISSWNDNKDDPFINIMFVDGPITRNGGACSYGSVEHRDMMMSAADSANCVGHIFHINTPGGSAWAKNDYQQAIDYARSKKQPVVAFVDGMCCSAGMYLAALCDNRYYMHPKDEIGCIGVMAAFYTEKDGTKCEYTNETYHELYDPESYDKNKEFRDIANDGNDELLIQELTKLGVEFRADVKDACPKVKEEHLHGKVFAAQEVNGILMDGQKSLGEVFDVVIEKGVKNGLQSAKNAYNMLNPKNNIEMKEKFPKVFALLGVEEMECNEEGTFFNASLLETMEAKIGEMQQKNAEAKALADQLTAEKEDLTKQVADLNAQMETAKADHEKAIETLNTEHASAIEEKDNQISALEQEKTDLQTDVNAKAEQIENLNTQLETANNTLAERDQQITDLNAQVEELTKSSGAEPQAGAAPQNNGDGVQQQEIGVNQYVFDKNLPYEENLRLQEEFEKNKKK